MQVVQEFLGETVDGCSMITSIFECCGIGDILINVATRKYCVLLHALKRVQAVEDITIKIVKELATP